MKKAIAVAVFLFAVVVSGTFGQTSQERMPDLKAYFMQANQLKSPEWDFTNSPFLGDDPTDSDRFSNLTGNLKFIDSYLEFALLTYYSAAEKPWAERGNAILPLNNPRLVDRQLGAYVNKDLIIYRFLGDTAAAGRYEGMLKFITDRGNVTRAEVEAFYRDNVRGLIAGVVDEEFNKISFLVENYSTNSRFSYDAVLMRNPQTGQYTLSYERASVENDDKTLTAASLDALLSVMRNSGDFVPAAIDTVRAQAALIPAVVYADWKQKGVAGGVDALALITETLTNFYLNPGQQTYEVILGIYARYRVLIGAKDVFADEALSAYRSRTIYALSPELGKKVVDDMQLVNIMETAKIPTDRRYDVFSTPYR